MKVTPDRATFGQLVAQHEVVTVSTSLVSDLITPVAAFMRLTHDSPDRVLLESTDNAKRMGRYSILVAGVRQRVVVGDSDDAFAQLQSLADLAPRSWRDESQAEFPFVSGVIYTIGFECFASVEPSVGASPTVKLVDVPRALLLTPSDVVVFDHWRQSVSLLHNVYTADFDVTSEDAADAAYASAVAALQDLTNRGATPMPEPVLTVNPSTMSLRDPFAEWPGVVTADDYAQMVESVQQHIAAGDIFQAVPSAAFVAPFSPDMLMVYRAMRHLNPSPYLYFFDTPQLKLAGASPEALVRVLGRKAMTRPIAGTRGRGATDEQDAELAADLLADAKEIAEHVMLVDLARNDLGRVSEYGSVNVAQFQQVEYFSHVMHICSTVESTVSADCSAVDVLKAVFPAGTLSGAPKIRAVQLLNQYEATPRGPYGGVVGYLDYNGNLDAAICIRTVMQDSDGVTWTQTGAGVVKDSVPQTEVDEVRRKASSAVVAASVARSFGATP